MKILPSNELVKQDLSFRLKLEVQFDLRSNTAISGLNLTQVTSGLNIADSAESSEQGLDMDFEIERTSGKEPSACALTIYNMSDSTFNQISNRGNVFRLYFAQGKDDWGLLFQGTPHLATQKHVKGGNNTSRGFLNRDDSKGGDNDVATMLYLVDSLNSFEKATISKSYQGNVSTRKILSDCAAAMGVDIGDEVLSYPEINNFVARGSVIKVVNEICGKIGCNHVIENGVLHLFNGENNNAYGYLFNGDNSSRPEQEQDDNKIMWHFTTKLLTNLRGGQFCVCDFGTLNGTYEIDKVRLIGNNYGTAGQSEVWVK